MSETMPVVDGVLMVHSIKQLGYVPSPNFDEARMLREEAERRHALIPRYRDAGFQAMGDKCHSEGVALYSEAKKLDYENELQGWRDQGFFVIKIPEWDDRLSITDSLNIPYKVVSTKRRLARFGDYQALYAVNIENWVGDVPIQVLEAVEQFKDQFKVLQIMFVAKRDQVKNLVADFVRQDPILVGQMRTWDKHMIVLKMWGDDLEEISLATFDPELNV